MEFAELTDEQIAKLTPEQIEMLENDPGKLAEIMAGQEKSSEKSTDEPEQEEEDAANGEGEDEDDDQEDKTDEDEEEKPVVLTKNGKGTIPYEKYKELRVQNAELRDKLQSLQKSQTELESLRAKQAEAKTPERRAELKKQLIERTERLKEDFPEIGESMTSVKEIVDDLERQIEEDRAEAKRKAEEAEAEKKRMDDEQKRIIDEQVQEAKENNPYLTHWEAHDEDAWREAMLQDQVLLNTPKWAKKSLEERFAEVVKRVKTNMPEASEPPNASPSAEVKEKAKAKIDKAVAKKPTTLSDIRSGANPASEREQLENLSPFELAQKLMKMPAQSAAAMRADLD